MTDTGISAEAESVELTGDMVDVDAIGNEPDPQDTEDNEVDQNPDDVEPEEGDDEGMEEAEWEGEQYKLPKGMKEALLRHADYTKKTMAVAEQAKAVEARETALRSGEERTLAFAQDIAKLGELNAKLAPFQQVTDWGQYLRQASARGPEHAAAAQADYADYQALTGERDAFAQGVSRKVQQRDHDQQQETAKQIEAGRTEIAKHIKGYSPEMRDKLATFAEPYGFSTEEIRQAEADPRSIRVLHLAMIGQEALRQQKTTSTIAQAAKTKPVKTLRGAGGQILARADTDDFRAFERRADQTLGSAR